MIITPNIFTDIFESELEYEENINEETLKKLIRNANFLADLIPLGTIIWININRENVDPPDPYYWQICNGGEITANHSPLKTNPTLPDEKKRTPNLLNSFVRFSQDANTNGSVNLIGVEVNATFVRLFPGHLTTIMLKAKEGGQIGNSIILVGNGLRTINELAANWNASHSSNEVTVTQGGAEVMIVGDSAQLSGGRNASGESGSQYHNLSHNHLSLGSAGPGHRRDDEDLFGSTRSGTRVHSHGMSAQFGNDTFLNCPAYLYLTPYLKII